MSASRSRADQSGSLREPRTEQGIRPRQLEPRREIPSASGSQTAGATALACRTHASEGEGPLLLHVATQVARTAAVAPFAGSVRRVGHAPLGGACNGPSVTRPFGGAAGPSHCAGEILKGAGGKCSGPGRHSNSSVPVTRHLFRSARFGLRVVCVCVCACRKTAQQHERVHMFSFVACVSACQYMNVRSCFPNTTALAPRALIAQRSAAQLFGRPHASQAHSSTNTSAHLRLHFFDT